MLGNGGQKLLHTILKITQILALSLMVSACFNSSSTPDNFTDPDLAFKAGMDYEFGNAVEIDLDKAISYYERSIKLGSDRGHFPLGIIYADGDKIPANYDKAIYHLNKANSATQAWTSHRLGNIYADENSPYLNLKNAEKYYITSANLDHLEAMDALIIIYSKRQDKAEELTYWRNMASRTRNKSNAEIYGGQSGEN